MNHDTPYQRCQPVQPTVTTSPYGLQEAIRNTTAEIFDVPMPPPQVREAEEKVQFSRPSGHQERAQSTLSEVSGFRSAQ